MTNDRLIKFSRNAIITVPDAILGAPFFENGDTIPQFNADNRRLLWAIASPEGGASSINAGAYCRGTNQVYSQWEAIAGPLWSVNRILKIYKQLEDYHGETNNPAARGYHGPIDVRQIQNPSQVSLTFTQAVINAIGVPFVLDYNDPTTPIGASSQLQNTQKGRNGRLRVSSSTAFLNKRVMTPNGRGVDGRKLHVLFESTALRTIWEGNKAVGVEYVRNGKLKRVFAKKGVIICCGLKSSFFLLHSGVGPKNLLESFNIPVVFDNPNVGESLADQPGIVVAFASNRLDTPLKNDYSLFSQISWLPAPDRDPTKREVRIAILNQLPGVSLAFLDLCQAKSRGNILINSADPLASPVVNVGALNNSEDLTLYQEVFQIYLKALNQAVQALDPEYRLIYPDPVILDDIEAVTAFIKANIQSNQSFEGHCRMAPQEEAGVVDSTGHVYGVRHLIIADDSIIPEPMDGSTMATAYLIAANIAQILIDANKD